MYNFTVNIVYADGVAVSSALLALCEGNLPVTGGFPSRRPVARRFDVFFDLSLNKRLRKYSRRRWFVTPPRSLWRHPNEFRNMKGDDF